MTSTTVTSDEASEILLAGLTQCALTSVTDSKGVITFANDLFCTTSGYSRKQLLGKHNRILKSDVHPGEFFQNLWKAVLNGKTWHGDICNRKKSGELYWVNTTIIPVDGEATRPRFLSIMFEITQTKESEEAVAKTRRALQKLCSTLSHEINNPLTIVDGNLKIMNRHLGDPERLKWLLATATKATHRIAEVMRDVKIYSDEAEEPGGGTYSKK